MHLGYPLAMGSAPQHVLVVGAGYVGLTTAIGLAAAGHRVELVEIRPDRLDALRAGILPIYEPGLRDAFDDAAVRSRITISALPTAGRVDAVLLCVGTPMDGAGRGDLQQVESALSAVHGHLTAGATLIIRSTLPVGSTDQVLDWSAAPTSRTFTNPEFLRQGSALEDFLHPTRVVIGCFPDADPTAVDRVQALLRVDPAAPFLVVGIAEADLIKNGANAFLALKLSFTNELASLSEVLSADIDAVLEGIGLDPRIGRSYMRPSFGFGGSCLPKELATLAGAGRERGLPMQMTAAAAEANESHQRRFADRILAALGDPRTKRVALLGLAFKAGTDDVRLSPALNVARILLDAGATVVAHDPMAGRQAIDAVPSLVLATSADAALAAADVAVIATDWPEYAELDWTAIRGSMATPLVFDGRRALRSLNLAALGFRYESVGSASAVDGSQSRDWLPAGGVSVT
jgi:UDPglucose 6-dehydrogenase